MNVRQRILNLEQEKKAVAKLILILIFFIKQSVCFSGVPLKIARLTANTYIYTTYKDLNGYLFPSNSMYVVTDSGIVLLDTPWDSTQFQPLLDSIAIKHQQPVVLCIASHFHDDRTAGLEYFSSKGIATWSSEFTKELCIKNGEKTAQNIFINDTIFRVGGYSFETFYPGEGHTPDNIVVWIPELKILYGGCFVKSVELKDLGNIADANIENWPVSIQNVLDKYPDAVYIIPGHFGWSKKNALKHTLKLIRKN